MNEQEFNALKAGSPRGLGKETFVDPLYEADKLSDELLAQVRTLADRLIGSSAPDDKLSSGAGPQAVPNGLFSEISSRAGLISNRLRAALDLVQRISRDIP